jgi:putative transcriptional regulator
MSFSPLSPCLLLAAPELGDPNFERTVVLLARHEEDGAIGWVLNGSAIAAVGELLVAAELVPEGLSLPRHAAFQRKARVGGPVAPRSGWLLYPKRLRSFEDEIDAGPDLCLCNRPDALNAVMRGESPHDFRLLLGYAGWGAGQLESELKAGAWLPTALDPQLVLETDADLLFSVAYETATGLSPDLLAGGSWARA